MEPEQRPIPLFQIIGLEKRLAAVEAELASVREDELRRHEELMAYCRNRGDDPRWLRS
jgi:hypothetical protein